jgi:hypothetical protein
MSTLPLQARIVRAALFFWPFAFAWYRLTQTVTYWIRPTAPIPTTSREDAVRAIGEGMRWRADRKGLDIMSHPRVVQALVLLRKVGIGDCEDHAGRTLAGSNVRHGRLVSVLMWDPQEQRVTGHVVAAWKLLGGPYYEWTDYNEDMTAADSMEDLGLQVAEGYERQLLGVSWCPVSIDKRQGLRFRYLEGGHWKNDAL